MQIELPNFDGLTGLGCVPSLGLKIPARRILRKIHISMRFLVGLQCNALQPRSMSNVRGVN